MREREGKRRREIWRKERMKGKGLKERENERGMDRMREGKRENILETLD